MEYDQKMEEVFPNAGEDLVDFLNRCKLKDAEVMLCPRCSAVFDKKAAKGLQELKVQVPKPKSKCVVDRRPNFSFDKPQFGDKPKTPMKIDSDPLQVEEANLVEPVETMVVEADTAKVVHIRDAMKLCSHEVMMVHIDDNLDTQVKEVTKWEYDQKMEEVFPNAGEDLVDFLNKCKLEDTEVMLCPR